MKEKKKLSLATKTFIGFGLGIVIGARSARTDNNTIAWRRRPG